MASGPNSSKEKVRSRSYSRTCSIRAKQDSRGKSLQLDLIVHQTNHAEGDGLDFGIQETFRRIVHDDELTAQICADVVGAQARGRNTLILTQWTEHLERIVDGLTQRGVRCLVLRGGMGKKAGAAVTDQLADLEPGSGRYSSQPVATWGKDTTARSSTHSSLPSRLPTRGASSSTSVESCVSPRGSRSWRSTTTWMSGRQCYSGCMRSVYPSFVALVLRRTVLGARRRIPCFSVVTSVVDHVTLAPLNEPRVCARDLGGATR
jgi:hypothetical protein